MKTQLTSEQTAKRKKTNTIILLIAAVVLLPLVYFAATDTTNENTETTPVEKAEVNNSFITGLAPADVYLNLEKQGFTTTKLEGGDYGSTWTSKLSDNGINYEVSIYSSDNINISNVRVTAMVDITTRKIDETKLFFKEIYSLNYTNAKPEVAAAWFDNNFNTNKADTTISDVKFSIIAPTIAVRTLMLEKAN